MKAPFLIVYETNYEDAARALGLEGFVLAGGKDSREVLEVDMPRMQWLGSDAERQQLDEIWNGIKDSSDDTYNYFQSQHAGSSFLSWGYRQCYIEAKLGVEEFGIVDEEAEEKLKQIDTAEKNPFPMYLKDQKSSGLSMIFDKKNTQEWAICAVDDTSNPESGKRKIKFITSSNAAFATDYFKRLGVAPEQYEVSHLKAVIGCKALDLVDDPLIKQDGSINTEAIAQIRGLVRQGLTEKYAAKAAAAAAKYVTDFFDREMKSHLGIADISQDDLEIIHQLITSSSEQEQQRHYSKLTTLNSLTVEQKEQINCAATSFRTIDEKVKVLAGGDSGKVMQLKKELFYDPYQFASCKTDDSRFADLVEQVRALLKLIGSWLTSKKVNTQNFFSNANKGGSASAHDLDQEQEEDKDKDLSGGPSSPSS